ncbi:hypothetical protein B0H63DRAFT_12553 [Podospora didyma]|uniref:Uncharacterized protein n=1 Tax=Podospora didyma TaxID=330526 RepID=A0AAE0P4K2_9PEZI|nr:hypothetical protein B0H63DRAFT_12553 [Podospora didyma]
MRRVSAIPFDCIAAVVCDCAGRRSLFYRKSLWGCCQDQTPCRSVPAWLPYSARLFLLYSTEDAAFIVLALGVLWVGRTKRRIFLQAVGERQPSSDDTPHELAFWVLFFPFQRPLLTPDPRTGKEGSVLLKLWRISTPSLVSHTSHILWWRPGLGNGTEVFSLLGLQHTRTAWPRHELIESC